MVFGKASGFGTGRWVGRQVIDLTTLSRRRRASSSRAMRRVTRPAQRLLGGRRQWRRLRRPDRRRARGDDGGSDAGEAYVVFGKASGFGTAVGRPAGDRPHDALAAAGLHHPGRCGRTTSAGFSVSSAGDVNGDGFDDLIVGAPCGDDGGTDAGEAYVVFGKASGFGTVGTARPAGDRPHDALGRRRLHHPGRCGGRPGRLQRLVGGESTATASTI